MPSISLSTCTRTCYCTDMMSSIVALKGLTALALGTKVCNPLHASATCAMLATLPSLVRVEICVTADSQAVAARLLSTLPVHLTFLCLRLDGSYERGIRQDAQLAWEPIPALQRLESLHTLELRYHGRGVDGDHVVEFASAIGSLERLRELVIETYNFDEKAARALAPHVARLQWLTHLNICRSVAALGEAGARVLASHLARLPRLQCLSLQGRTPCCRADDASHTTGAQLHAALQGSGGMEICS